ncbi:MAG: hypothetical protein HQL04_00635 [Nitrospirae bacterium]|nr:hypothetical protein [Nitrospirota bacterium]
MQFQARDAETTSPVDNAKNQPYWATCKGTKASVRLRYQAGINPLVAGRQPSLPSMIFTSF